MPKLSFSHSHLFISSSLLFVELRVDNFDDVHREKGEGGGEHCHARDN